MAVSYRGHEMEIRQEKNDSSGYEYTVELYVDGDYAISASRLSNDFGYEDAGHAETLFRYGRAYIDGIERSQ